MVTLAVPSLDVNNVDKKLVLDPTGVKDSAWRFFKWVRDTVPDGTQTNPTRVQLQHNQGLLLNSIGDALGVKKWVVFETADPENGLATIRCTESYPWKLYDKWGRIGVWTTTGPYTNKPSFVFSGLDPAGVSRPTGSGQFSTLPSQPTLTYVGPFSLKLPNGVDSGLGTWPRLDPTDTPGMTWTPATYGNHFGGAFMNDYNWGVKLFTVSPGSIGVKFQNLNIIGPNANIAHTIFNFATRFPMANEAQTLINLTGTKECAVVDCILTKSHGDGLGLDCQKAWIARNIVRGCGRDGIVQRRGFEIVIEDNIFDRCGAQIWDNEPAREQPPLDPSSTAQVDYIYILNNTLGGWLANDESQGIFFSNSEETRTKHVVVQGNHSTQADIDNGDIEFQGALFSGGIQFGPSTPIPDPSLSGTGQSGYWIIRDNRRSGTNLTLMSRFSNLHHLWVTENQQFVRDNGNIRCDRGHVNTLLTHSNVRSLEDGTTAPWVNVANATLTNSTEQAGSGTHSLKMTAIAAGNMEARAGSASPAMTTATLETNRYYVARADMRSKTAGGKQARAKIYWYNASNALIATSVPVPSDYVTLSTTAWKEVSCEARAPATAARATVSFEVLNAGAGQEYYLDKAELGADDYFIDEPFVVFQREMDNFMSENNTTTAGVDQSHYCWGSDSDPFDEADWIPPGDPDPDDWWANYTEDLADILPAIYWRDHDGEEPPPPPPPTITVPTGLAVSVTVPTDPDPAINAQWDANTQSNFLKFQVRIVGQPVQDTVVPSWDFENVAPNTQYCVQVRALSTDGQVSAFCTQVCKTTNNVITAPGVPNLYTATPGDEEVILGWDQVLNADDYIVLIRESLVGGSFAAIATVTTLTYTVTDLVNDTAYDFRVRARNVVGTANSNIMVSTPFDPDPPPPPPEENPNLDGVIYLFPPHMVVVTTAQRDLMTVEDGSVIFNSTTNTLEYYIDGDWKVLGP